MSADWFRETPESLRMLAEERAEVQAAEAEADRFDVAVSAELVRLTVGGCGPDRPELVHEVTPADRLVMSVAAVGQAVARLLCAVQGSNLRPLPCKGSTLPLS